MELAFFIGRNRQTSLRKTIPGGSEYCELSKTTSDFQGVDEAALLWAIWTDTSEEVTFYLRPERWGRCPHRDLGHRLFSRQKKQQVQVYNSESFQSEKASVTGVQRGKKRGQEMRMEKGGWVRNGDVTLMALGSPWRIGSNKANINL